MSNRYNQQTNYVIPAAKPLMDGQQISRLAESALQMPTNAEIDAAALRSLEGAAEKTSGMDRALALVVRMAPYSAVWLALSIGVSWGAGMGGAFLLVFFAALMSITYAYMDWQDHRHSRNGLERHKAGLFADIRHHEIDSQERIQIEKIDAFLEITRRVYHVQHTDPDAEDPRLAARDSYPAHRITTSARQD